MKVTRFISLVLITAFFFTTIVSSVYACKNIMVMNDATAGDFNLLMKIRDPSRADYQTLTIVPKGYEYQYHNESTEYMI